MWFLVQIQIYPLYKKIENKNILISKDNFWGHIDDNIKKYIINKLVIVTHLSSEEKQSIKIDNSITDFKQIPNNNNQETQKILITINANPVQAVPIMLTWQLTTNQKPIYWIYKGWKSASTNYFSNHPNLWTLNCFPIIWDKDHWDKRKQIIYSKLNLNNNTVAPLIKEYIENIWNSLYPSHIDKKLINLPNKFLLPGEIVNINNIKIQKGNSEFPLFAYSSTIKQSNSS